MNPFSNRDADMERGSVILAVILLALALGAGLFFILRGREDTQAPVYNTPNTSTTTAPNTQMVRVYSPVPNSLITAPLIVTGEARGNWYFEASFPIKVLDANGKQLGISHAQAEGDPASPDGVNWMTTNFVPFRGTVSFATSTTVIGTLVLEKDNPSGLPQNAAEVRIPIRFFQISQEQTRAVKLYFYNENKDKDANGNILCSAKGLVSVNRLIPLTITPIQDAVRELLKGPTSLEKLQALGTEFPLGGVALTGANLSGGALTLSFADPQNKTSGGSCRVQILKAQIEATAKQFGGVNAVSYQPSGIFQP